METSSKSKILGNMSANSSITVGIPPGGNKKQMSLEAETPKSHFDLQISAFAASCFLSGLPKNKNWTQIDTIPYYGQQLIIPPN